MKHDDLLGSWAALNTGVKKLTETQAKALLDAERNWAKRQSFLLRIYGRYNTLRTKRERKELMSE